MLESQSKRNTFLVIFLLVYFVWLFFNMGHIIPHFDSFYYWDWSRHLALSYYDGPPLIAYVLALYTKLFGNTLFAINFFSLTTVYITGFIIYKAMRLIISQRESLIAFVLWVTNPIITEYLIRKATYDNVLCLFWALSIYFTIKFILDNKNRDLYWIGVSLGLAMLSKYSAVVLILGLIAFSLISARFRKLYLNIHFYIALALIIAVFSPVIIWNIQHHWISISYQSTTHVAHDLGFGAHLLRMLKTMGSQIVLYNYLLVIIIYGCVKRWSEVRSDEVLQLLLITSALFFVFYTIVGSFANVHPGWLVPFCVAATILAAYFIVTLKMSKTAVVLIVVYSIASILLLLANSFLAKRVTVEGGRLGAIEVFNQRYGERHPIIVTSSWMSARMLFFLKGQPPVYTLPCSEENQYHYWSRKVFLGIKAGSVKRVLYVDFVNQHQCIAKYFTRCQQLPDVIYYQRHFFSKKVKTYRLYVYSCLRNS